MPKQKQLLLLFVCFHVQWSALKRVYMNYKRKQSFPEERVFLLKEHPTIKGGNQMFYTGASHTSVKW